MASEQTDCVVFTLGGEVCGLPIPTVRDVLDRVAVAPVPLAPAAIAGHLNLRGRIVTAIDLAERVGSVASNDHPAARRTAIVVDQGTTLYALLVDEVREVLPVPADEIGPVPAWLPPRWAALATGVVKRQGELLVLLDPERILTIAERAA